ncbi:MAG: prenyltransferase/squalene oxidase repeat-containing protein [Planctomycetota bacterium]
MSTIRWRALVVALAGVLVAPAAGVAQNPAPAVREFTPALTSTVDRGLAALVAMQEVDGSWTSGRYGKNVAVVSLACLALMADGNLPGRGPYGDAVEAGLRWILDQQTETGLIAAQTSHGPMYGHGFATLFLGEVYGMAGTVPGDPDERRLHDALIRATRLILGSQNRDGGWRYNPVPNDADVSVTICQVMALRSVRNAGLEVPADAIDRAVDYVRRCQNPDGGFRYQLNNGPSAWPRTAAGVAALFYAGVYEGDDIENGLDYLIDTALPGGRRPSRSHYFYGHYYAAQAMVLAGGQRWAQWWPAIRAELIRDQNVNGGWDDQVVGEAYGTAMALIVLQMPKRYLPIFQR